LEVKDKAPLHGSVELNNRFVTNTTELRLDTSVSYGNLWQKGHVLGLSSQIAPNNLDDSLVVSGFYLVRFPQLSKFSLQLTASKQDSFFGSLAGVASVGDGSTMGLRGMVQLPTRGSYFHSVSGGFDYKAFANTPSKFPGVKDTFLTPEAITFLEDITPAIHYYPITVSYSAGLPKKNSFTEFNAALQLHLRGLGSDVFTFYKNRYPADGSWVSLRSDIAHTQDLPKGFQVFSKFQTQLTNDALIPNEQFVIGGASTVRGYPEASVLGDNGWVFNFEVRTPSLIRAKGQSEGGTPDNEFRFRSFFDAGTVYVNEVLPEQTETFELASFGFGTSIDLAKNFHGNLDLAWPLTTQGITPNTPSGSPRQHEPFLSFQVGYDF
jgi:hemolysin activation/secretion protein